MSDTHWKKLTNPNYLGSWDFQKGEERILTISRVVQEEVFNPSGNSMKPCTVAYFLENSKPMVLNKTNCKTLEALCKTPYIERWSGCLITVVVKRVKAFGKLEDGLRIKDEKPDESHPEQQTFICTNCGGEITGFSTYTAIQVVGLNRKRYGADLCANCSSERKSAESEESGNAIDK